MNQARFHAQQRFFWLHLIGLCTAVLLTLASARMSWADDTEIFRAEYEDSNSRPKVLIIFDNSSSMVTNTVPDTREDYNPSTTYPQMGAIQPGRLYWASGQTGSPPAASTANWFDANRNRCASSYGSLNVNADGTHAASGSGSGFFIGRFARWGANNPGGSSNSWRDLSSSFQTPTHVECSTDVGANSSSSNNGNGTGTGNPGNGYPRTSSPTPYGNRQSGVGDGWTTYRVYSANYMNYYHNPDIPKSNLTRLAVAQRVVTEVIRSSPDIDFGLAVFNNNNSTPHGGRIAHRIIENMTGVQRTGLVDLVAGLTAPTYTPLCETMYEVYRYFSGDTPLYGNATNPTNPPRDLNAQSGGKYISPLGGCQYVYVILMTDGEPTNDTQANSAIKSLTGKSCRNWSGSENCLPEMVEYMANVDLDGDPNNGVQKAITYTIGFATNQALLSETARVGGGQYFTADNVEELTAAFQGAITGILSINTTFTSPAVAVDSFSRTESRNEVFFGMFRPEEGTNWPGNIKKLRADASSGSVVLKDQNNVDAIDAAKGSLKETAQSYWSSTADGADVTKGGVGERLLASNLANRVLKTNVGNSLESFVYETFISGSCNTACQQTQRDKFNAADNDELRDLLAWARGWTNRSANVKRDWIMGDILHSRPVILDYGARADYSPNPGDPLQDLRVVVGTNAGFLHMFHSNTGNEAWAFFPQELGRIIKERRKDTVGGESIYGVDSPVVVYQYDENNDGIVNGNDKMYIFFGLRGGGRAYYGMDVTDPDAPALLWKIDNTSTGFSELGQTWSVPMITHIPGYTETVNGKTRPKPVLLFGGGYDPAYDNHNTTAAGTTASMGRGIYIVDAASGSLLWSATAAANSATNKQVVFPHPIAAPLTVFDSDGDHLADRIYATDVGGNVWRIDMAVARPATPPNDFHNKWQVSKVAALGSDVTNNAANDRRFFSAVDVASVTTGGRNYFMLLLGSGDRTNPLAIDNSDRFYMLRDMQFTPLASAPPTNQECDPTNGARKGDIRCSWPLTHANLYDAGQNLVQAGTGAQQQAALTALNAAKGWYLPLVQGAGEKSLAAAITLGGKVYFTTFTPPSDNDNNVNICVPTNGTARQYVVGLSDARAMIDYDLDSVFETSERSRIIGYGIYDTPSTFFKARGSGGGVELIRQDGRTEKVELNINRRVRTYWYDREF